MERKKNDRRCKEKRGWGGGGGGGWEGGDIIEVCFERSYQYSSKSVVPENPVERVSCIFCDQGELFSSFFLWQLNIIGI